MGIDRLIYRLVDRSNAQIPPFAALLSRPYSIKNRYVRRRRFCLSYRSVFVCLISRIIMSVFDVAGFEKEEKTRERVMQISLPTPDGNGYNARICRRFSIPPFLKLIFFSIIGKSIPIRRIAE